MPLAASAMFCASIYAGVVTTYVFIHHNIVDRARHVFSPHLLNRVGSIKIGTNGHA
jgi:hypothetical protein